jgi:putative CocE/NonD family hydrolase
MRMTIRVGGRSTRGFLAVVLAAAATAGATLAPPASAATTESWGYLTVRDGTRLRFDLLRPDDSRRHPVVINYEGYGAGTDANDNGGQTFSAQLLARGYAVLGVSVRGTGCSAGVFDPFEKRLGLDGYDAVEWAARQPWSDGRVGMFGLSFGAITQLITARHRPPHLVALAASSSLADIYRDVAYPGGILNDVFPFAWAVLQNEGVTGVAQKAVPAGDTECLANLVAHGTANVPHNVPQFVLDHPYADDDVGSGQTYRDRSPYSGLGRIEVPSLLFNAWQDEQLVGRLYEWLGAFGNTSEVWANFSNGHHGRDYSSAPAVARTLAFLDRFVRGVDNGFERRTAHLTLWMDSTLRSSVDHVYVPEPNLPAWEIPLPLVPRIRARSFYLGSGGGLTERPPASAEAVDSYRYPLPSVSVLEPGQVNTRGYQSGQLSWKSPVPPGGSLAYTSARMRQDMVLAGPASLDLWLSSTQPDTDVQVTVTELRPDGQETYVQRGWLRASHRRLDPRLSTVVRPYQTHARADLADLVPGRPTLMRIEVLPFAHAFRKGSRLRVWLDAPTGQTGLAGFAFLTDAATNTVLHDAAHPSRLVVGVLPGQVARAPLPTCDTLVNQPCRSDPLALPLP